MAQFHVICLETSEPIKGEHGETLVFTGGAEAARFAAEMSATLGSKHQPRPIKTDDWQTREAKRLEDGTYTRTPWDVIGQEYEDYCGVTGRWIVKTHTQESASGVWWYACRKAEAEHHYAHVSLKHPGKIAFTESAEKGAQDIQATMNIGRYLTRFYDLTGEDVRGYANEFAAKYGELQLRFAATEDEIEQVYVNGPRSCMSKRASDYASSCHPCRAYAAGDLQVAYLTATDDEDHITSRVLCWPKNKTYGRVYGDTKIETFLDGLGYSQDDEFAEGARMLKIEQGCGQYVVPYVDGIHAATDYSGKYLKISARGEICCERTDGLSEESGRQCERCGDRYDDENEVSYIESRSESWCDHCTERHAFYCDVAGETIANDDGVRMANGDMWSQRRFDREGATDEDGENHPIDDVVFLADGTCWHTDYFADHGRQCSHCSECVRNEPVCEQCGEPEDTEETAAPARKHVARQGRDELPGQLEIPLPSPAPLTIAKQAEVGDSIFIVGEAGLREGWHRVETVDDRPAYENDGLRLQVRNAYGELEYVFDRNVHDRIALASHLQAAE